MNTTSHLTPLDVAIAAYLAHYRTLGRGYGQEEWVLGLLRTSLAERGATDLDQERFDQWRGTFVHLHLNSRHTYERIVGHFCRYRRRSKPDCFLPDPTTLVRPITRALPTPIEPAQIEDVDVGIHFVGDTCIAAATGGHARCVGIALHQRITFGRAAALNAR